jgi:hypothetical protein
MRSSTTALAATLALLLAWAAPAAGQSDAGGRQSDAESSSEGARSTIEDPIGRLEMAETAFREGEFERLPDLLRPLLEPEPKLEEASNRIRARELLGVGLFFAAQQTTDPKERDRLTDEVRHHFLQLLRERPDYQLDSLIFPASVVDIFESVRRDNTEELDSIRRRRNTSGGNGGPSETLYIAKDVRENVYWLNYLPLGVGQYQNQQQLKGTLFGGAQLMALAYQGLAYWQIERRRLPNGQFPNPELCNCSDLQAARGWRTSQWIALGLFGAIYAGSVIDGLVNYSPRRVRIRTLDEPPPELESGSSSTGNAAKLRIGLGSVQIRW